VSSPRRWVAVAVEAVANVGGDLGTVWGRFRRMSLINYERYMAEARGAEAT
jgi:hypothetical protein